MESIKAPAFSSPKSAITRAEEALHNVQDPRTKNALASLIETVRNSPLRKEVEEFKKEILKKPLPPEQQVFSFLPHQLAKTSIFFPMSDKELKEENRKIHKFEHKTSWGNIVIEGVKLAIYEEDIFLALLFLSKNKTQSDGEHAYVLKTTMPEVAKILYKDKGYTKSVYERIERCLDHFQLIRFEITTGEWKKKGGEKIRKETTLSIAGIITSFLYKRETQELIIRWNPEFFTFFLESMLSYINLTVRRKLKKDGSKALLRFLSTHTNPGRIGMEVVLEAINFNTNQPKYQWRRRFKSFLAELKRHGLLGKKTKLLIDDNVYFDFPKKERVLP